MLSLRMITYTSSGTDEEFAAIIQLQKENLSHNLSDSEIKEQGFVTVCHSMDDLRKMNVYEQNLVIKDENKIVGYILAMTKHSQADIPALMPMFERLDKIAYNNKSIADYNYLVVGQVCISKPYRGQGLFDKGYAAYKTMFKDKYEFVVTAIARSNTRSMQAHKRVGFTEVFSFTTDDVEWSIVLWNWS